jgi:hypothetical protein
MARDAQPLVDWRIVERGSGRVRGFGAKGPAQQPRLPLLGHLVAQVALREWRLRPVPG